jgi:hypothetical protein
MRPESLSRSAARSFAMSSTRPDLYHYGVIIDSAGR